MRVFNPYVGWVEVPSEVRRVVSINPSVTEVLFEIGVEDRVVGVSSWCHKPERARLKPKVASYTKVLIDKVRELSPDIVFTTTGVQKSLINELLENGFVVYPVPVPKSVFEILGMVVEVGGLLGKQDEALRLVNELVSEISEITRLRREGLVPRVYIEIDLGGPTIPAYFNHITSALSLAGFANVFANETAGYLYGMRVKDYEVFDLSRVVEEDPDLIVYESKSFNPSPDEFTKIASSRGWLRLRAVREGRVLVLPADTLAHYGPSFLRDFKRVAELMWSKVLT